MRMARVVPADLHKVIAESDVERQRDVSGDVSIRVRPEGIRMQGAVQLDLARLVGRHVRSRHNDILARHRSRRRDRDGGLRAQEQVGHEGDQQQGNDHSSSEKSRGQLARSARFLFGGDRT